MKTEAYLEEQRIRVANNYDKAKHKGFADKNDFASWYVDQLIHYNCKCYYCEISVHDIVLLIAAGLVKERKIGYGFRGRVLEVDKNDDNYTKKNCVLSCYYCNNDKSYTMEKEAYKENFGPNRKRYFQKLLNELDQKHV